MFTEQQLTDLENLLQHLNAALHVEEATLEAGETLRLVLCNDRLCFPPLHIPRQAVDMSAVLAGQATAQQALLHYIRATLPGI
jgi:hypothetical protein